MNYQIAYFNAERSRKFAWSQVYQRDDTIVELQRRELRRPMTLEVIRSVIVPYRGPGGIEEPDVLPPHITRMMFEMARQLNKDYTCPVCFDFMTAETFSMTKCGHELCTKCFDYIRENTPLARKPTCPTCRHQL